MRVSKHGQPFGNIPTPFCEGGVFAGHIVNPGGQVVPGARVGNVGSAVATVGTVKIVGNVNVVGVAVEKTNAVEVGPVDGKVAPTGKVMYGKEVGGLRIL